MASEALSPGDYIDRPKGLSELTTAAIWPLGGYPLDYVGSEIVKVTCSDSPASRSDELHDGIESGYFCNQVSTTFSIHKKLLCCYSRYFREKLYGSLDKEVIIDALIGIENSPDKFLPYKDVAPAGYVPSWVTFAEQYRSQAQEPISQAEEEQLLICEQQDKDTIQLPGECKADFVIFTNWLYTQRLYNGSCFEEGHELNYIRMYSLAERLDVPALRRQCYEALRRIYKENNQMPGPETAEAILKSCQATSLLRKFMVATVAHEVICDGVESRESCDPILALDKGLAAEIALEIMSRLRCDEVSEDPNDEDEFEVDDSDPDVSSSIDLGSDFEFDSDRYLTFSDCEEDEESVNGDKTPAQTPALEESPSSSSELSSCDSDEDAGKAASGSSATQDSAPGIKTEGDSDTDHVLLGGNANKRKRPSDSLEDNESPPIKRPQTQMSTDLDFVDLTEGPNSD